MTRQRNRDERDAGGNQHRGQDQIARHVQRLDPIGKYERGEDIERRLLGHAQQRRQDDLLRLFPADFEDGRLLDLVVSQDLLENGCLQNAEADPQTDAHQNDGERKRNSPAPGVELVARHLAECENGKVGQKQTAWHAELRPGCHQPSFAVGARPFHGKQHRSTPFAADTDALYHPQYRQEDRAPDADTRVGRHKSDKESRNAHAQEGSDQRRLSADTVPVVTEDRGPDGTADETNEICAESSHCCCVRIFVRKIELAEDQACRCTVKEEVVPLDRSADGRGDNGFAQLRVVIRFRQVCLCNDGSHYGPLSCPLIGCFHVPYEPRSAAPSAACYNLPGPIWKALFVEDPYCCTAIGRSYSAASASARRRSGKASFSSRVRPASTLKAGM